MAFTLWLDLPAADLCLTGGATATLRGEVDRLRQHRHTNRNGGAWLHRSQSMR